SADTLRLPYREVLPGNPGPAVHEGLEEAAHGGTGNRNLCVAPAVSKGIMRAARAGAARIGFGQVDTAGEGDAAIDDQELSVSAVVEPRQLAPERVNRVVLNDADPRSREIVEEGAVAAYASDTVVDDCNGKPVPTLVLQSGGEFPSHLI